MKTALITGASKGIGRALAIGFAELCQGLVVCARSKAPLLRLKTEIEQAHPGIDILTVEADLSKPDELLEFIRHTDAHFADISFLVNNLGMYEQADIFSDSDDMLKRQMQTNFYPAYTLCRHYGEKMRKRRNGCIVNIGSTASFEPVAEAAAYTVTKFAVRGLTSVMQASLENSGVKVIGVYPGSTRTASWDDEQVPEDLKLLEPEQVADAVFTAIKSGQRDVHIKP